MLDILVIYRGDASGDEQVHPVHQEWFRTVNADELVVSDTILPSSLEHTVLRDVLLNRKIPTDLNYDIVIFESAATLYCAPLIRIKEPDAKLVFLDTTWRTHGPCAYNFDTFTYYKRAVYYADRKIDAYVLRTLYQHVLDGVLTVSEMMVEHVQSFTDVPAKVVRPTIDEDFANQLADITPALDETTAVYLGAARDHKGVDQLVEVWPDVRAQIPGATLQIVGSGHPNSYERVDGIEVLGYVTDLSNVFESASVQIHPARFDASPVSTLEGMQAGVPQIVTTCTGTRNEVKRINPSLVVDPTPDALTNQIISYFDSSLDKRRVYSNRARAIGEEFQESRRVDEFQDALNALLAAI